MSPQFPAIQVAKHIALLFLFTGTLARAVTDRIPEYAVTVVAFGDSTTAPRESLEVYSEILGKTAKSKNSCGTSDQCGSPG